MAIAIIRRAISAERGERPLTGILMLGFLIGLCHALEAALLHHPVVQFAGL